MSGLKKRSLSIAGHPTSIALEPEFWAALERAAASHDVSLPALVGRIDAERDPDRGLASAIRVWLLKRAERAGSSPPSSNRLMVLRKEHRFPSP